MCKSAVWALGTRWMIRREGVEAVLEDVEVEGAQLSVGELVECVVQAR